MRGLRVLLLGRPRLEVDGQALAADLPLKHQALLYYLAAAGTAVGRAELASLLWEDFDEAAARGNLRTALMRLRRALPGVLAADTHRIGFDPAVPLQVDWADLARAADGAGSYAMRAAAAQAWRGPLLEGFDLRGDAVERWLAAARSRAQRQAVDLRRALAGEASTTGKPDEAEAHWRALLEVDDADEEAHMALIALLAANGRRTAAIAQYEACRAALRDRLGARPSQACYALYTQIHAGGQAPPAPAKPPAADLVTAADAAPERPPTMPVSQEDAAPSCLPLPDGPLIGRQAELALLAERMADAECRWLTVVGPGGVGKTRLTLAAASALAPSFRHGALWISGRDAGGSLRDPETLIQRVLERTGADRVQPGALLLVLDNMENVADAAALAPSLLARAPGVRVLATSRRRLGGPREWLLELDGLPLAREHPGAPASSAAARLLAAAVRRLDPRFDPAAESDAVEALCQRVGGLPLALELAARGVLDAGLPAVLTRLANGAPLEDRDRDDAARQHSIEAVMHDSWVLLPAEAQAAALRLAWLPGAFDLPLAAAIGVAVTAVERLREHSWLRRTDGGTLSLHPLQQDFLRSRHGAAALRAVVRAALAAAVRAELPALAPFASWPADLPLPADQPRYSASVLAEAFGHVLETADHDALASWLDAVVALLVAADRQESAASMLGRAARRADLPAWRRAGWQMRQAELQNTLGDAVASMSSYEAALAILGLDGALRDGSGWRHLPAAVARAFRLPCWPASAVDRAAFGRIVARSLAFYTQQLSFTPSMDRAVRANLLATALISRAGGRPDRQAVRVMSAYGMLSTGRAALARGFLGSVARRARLSDPYLEAFTREGECATRIALGRWHGVVDELTQLHADLEHLGDHRHAMECLSLAAKLHFYQGHLARAAEAFAETTEASLRRPGGAWRAWGPFGQAEVALCLGDVALERVEQWLDLGSHWMTEMLNLDAAYALRRFGLAARLAWRRGEVGRARETVLGGVAATSRIAHCGFWAHEGLAGIGEVLLALRAHDLQLGVATGPLDAAWQTFDRRLDHHARSFPAGSAVLYRLRGVAAHGTGQETAARRWLRQAVDGAQAVGMRVELARSCEALAAVEPAAPWADRARGLWREMGVGTAPTTPCNAAGQGERER